MLLAGSTCTRTGDQIDSGVGGAHAGPVPAATMPAGRRVGRPGPSPIPRLAPALDQRVDPEAEADPGHGCPPISSSPTLSERISTSPARSLRTTASAIARRPIASAPIAAAASASGAMAVGAMARGPTTCGPMKRPPTAAASHRCRMRFVRFMTVPFRRFLSRSGPFGFRAGCDVGRLPCFEALPPAGQVPVSDVPLSPPGLDGNRRSCRTLSRWHPGGQATESGSTQAQARWREQPCSGGRDMRTSRDSGRSRHRRHGHARAAARRASATSARPRRGRVLTERPSV
jgi:hypothetical protein